jgi:predicted Zn-dependent peptidase
VIGEEATIRSIARAQMEDFYRRHYAPGNMTLLMTGDVDAASAERLARRYFGPIDRPHRPLVARPEPTRIAAAKRHHRAKPTGGEVYLTLTSGAQGVEEPEAIVPLDVAQYILGQGRASMLYQEIKEKRRLVSSIECHYATQRLGSIFMIDATCEPERREAAFAAIRETVGRFAAEPIDAEQLHRAKRLIRTGHLFSFETTGSASGQTGYYYNLTGGTEFLEGYLDRLDRVGARDVRAAFAAMLDRFAWIEVSVGPNSGGNGKA